MQWADYDEKKTTTVRIRKTVLNRKNWQKFGKCAGLTAGPEPGITTVSKENIFLNLKCQSQEELLEPVTKKVVASGTIYKPPSMRANADKEERYVPLHRRDKVREGVDVRIDNVSQDCSYDEIKLLVRSFGNVMKVTLPQNKKTGQTIGFAFITYQNEDDALFAISKLHGFGFQNCILSAHIVVE